MYLHVGAPKSGTTYIQDRLSRNARILRRHGLHVPNLFPSLTPARAQFRAALDLLGQDWGGPEGHAAGHWDRLVEKVRRTQGAVLISHEIFAPAPAEVIDKAVSDLGRDAELHIVYTARDYGRALTSAWQESVKAGRRWRLRKFLDLAHEHRNWFAKALELPDVLEAWGRDLPPEHVHVVTAPSGDGDSPALWERFCEVLGVPPGLARHRARRSNPSLDAVATEIIRQLNVRHRAGPNADPNRDRYVDALIDLLQSRKSERIPIELPPQDRPWVTERARSWIDWLEDHKVVVHGDVEDLIPSGFRPEDAWVNPDRLPRKAVRGLALDALHHVAARKRDLAAVPDQIVTGVRSRFF
ncbi:hypothetical protein [Nocardioides sp. KR10-350]|uniref:hypothetical protein n=1 Tax=Nocardioides cheoyonin TaxID=3156615 RepID=UPI0032B3A274